MPSPTPPRRWRAQLPALLYILHGAGIAAWARDPGLLWLAHGSALPLILWTLAMAWRNPTALAGWSGWLLALSTEDPGSGWIQWLSPALVAIAAAARLLHQRPARAALHDKLLWLLVLLIAWWVLCASDAERPAQAWGTLARMALTLAGTLLLLSGTDARTRRAWIRGHAFGLLLVLAYALLLSPHPGKGGAMPFLPGDNALAGALVPVVLALPWLWAPRPGRWIGTALAIAAGAWACWVSRGAMLGLMVGLAAMAVHVMWRRGMGTAAIALALAALCGLTLALWPGGAGGRGVFAPVNAFSNQERQMRWTVAVRIAQEHPLTGLGPGCYAPAFKRWLRTDAEVERIAYWPGWTGGAHQVGLTALAETGIPGMALMLAWLIGLLLRRWRHGQAWAWAGWTGLLAHMQVEDLAALDVVQGRMGEWAALPSSDEKEA